MQFEDILIESQLLEATLAGRSSPNFAQMASTADIFMTSATNPDSLTLPGLPTGPGGYPGLGLEGFDFDTSDDIFGERRGSVESNSSTNRQKTTEIKGEHRSTPTKKSSESRVPETGM